MSALVLAEDEAMLRTALTAVLRSDGHRVVDVASGGEVIAAVDEHRPEAVLLDIHLPERDGIDLAFALADRTAPPKLLLMTAIGRPAPIARALAAPIDALLLKSSTAPELVRAIRVVLDGGHVVDRELVSLAARADPTLTSRERSVLVAAADGSPVDEVAARLHLAPATVRNHITSILAKTGTRNRFEAVQHARELGLM